MASDNEATCEGDPNFAVICGFLEKFGTACGVGPIDFVHLQEMLENTHEVAPELSDLHIVLMRKIRKYAVSKEKWERVIIKICHSYNSQDAWELERFGYKKSRLGSKLRILKQLLEMQFDLNAKFKSDINKMTAEQLRTQPLGKDKLGHSYWLQSDETCQIRVYKEDPDEETWDLIAKDREGLVSLISQLGSNDTIIVGSEPILNEDSNSLEIEKPILDTGQNDSNSSNSKLSKKSSEDDSNEETDLKEKIKTPDDDKSNISVNTDSDSNIPVKEKDVVEEKDEKKVEEKEKEKVEEKVEVKVGEKVEEKVEVPRPLGLRLKPLTELLSQPALDNEKKPELSGIKEKYIRCDSFTSPTSHRKAVDSAGFDTAYRDDLKRSVDYDIEELSVKRPRMTRPTLLVNKKKPYSSEDEFEEEGEEADYEHYDDEYGEEVEEPLMLVRGEGSGNDNCSGIEIEVYGEGNGMICKEVVDIGISTEEDTSFNVDDLGEAIEDPIFYVYGEGMGVDCETGPEKEQKEDSSNEQKNENSINTIDDPCLSPSKNSYKLGTVIDSKKVDKKEPLRSPPKKSRWDIGKPGDNNMHDEPSSNDLISNDVTSSAQNITKIDSNNSDIEVETPSKSAFFFGPSSAFSFTQPTVSPIKSTFVFGASQKVEKSIDDNIDTEIRNIEPKAIIESEEIKKNCVVVDNKIIDNTSVKIKESIIDDKLPAILNLENKEVKISADGNTKVKEATKDDQIGSAKIKFESNIIAMNIEDSKTVEDGELKKSQKNENKSLDIVKPLLAENIDISKIKPETAPRKEVEDESKTIPPQGVKVDILKDVSAPSTLHPKSAKLDSDKLDLPSTEKNVCIKKPKQITEKKPLDTLESKVNEPKLNLEKTTLTTQHEQSVIERLAGSEQKEVLKQTQILLSTNLLKETNELQNVNVVLEKQDISLENSIANIVVKPKMLLEKDEISKQKPSVEKRENKLTIEMVSEKLKLNDKKSNTQMNKVAETPLQIIAPKVASVEIVNKNQGKLNKSTKEKLAVGNSSKLEECIKNMKDEKMKESSSVLPQIIKSMKKSDNDVIVVKEARTLKDDISIQPKIEVEASASKDDISIQPKIVVKASASKDDICTESKMVAKASASKDDISIKPKTVVEADASTDDISTQPKMLVKTNASKDDISIQPKIVNPSVSREDISIQQKMDPSHQNKIPYKEVIQDSKNIEDKKDNSKQTPKTVDSKQLPSAIETKLLNKIEQKETKSLAVCALLDATKEAKVIDTDATLKQPCKNINSKLNSSERPATVGHESMGQKDDLKSLEKLKNVEASYYTKDKNISAEKEAKNISKKIKEVPECSVKDDSKDGKPSIVKEPLKNLSVKKEDSKKVIDTDIEQIVVESKLPSNIGGNDESSKKNDPAIKKTDDKEEILKKIETKAVLETKITKTELPQLKIQTVDIPVIKKPAKENPPLIPETKDTHKIEAPIKLLDKSQEHSKETTSINAPALKKLEEPESTEGLLNLVQKETTVLNLKAQAINMPKKKIESLVGDKSAVSKNLLATNIKEENLAESDVKTKENEICIADKKSKTEIKSAKDVKDEILQSNQTVKVIISQSDKVECDNIAILQSKAKTDGSDIMKKTIESTKSDISKIGKIDSALEIRKRTILPSSKISKAIEITKNTNTPFRKTGKGIEITKCEISPTIKTSPVLESISSENAPSNNMEKALEITKIPQTNKTKNEGSEVKESSVANLTDRRTTKRQLVIGKTKVFTEIKPQTTKNPVEPSKLKKFEKLNTPPGKLVTKTDAIEITRIVKKNEPAVVPVSLIKPDINVEKLLANTSVTINRVPALQRKVVVEKFKLTDKIFQKNEKVETIEKSSLSNVTANKAISFTKIGERNRRVKNSGPDIKNNLVADSKSIVKEVPSKLKQQTKSKSELEKLAGLVTSVVDVKMVRNNVRTLRSRGPSKSDAEIAKEMESKDNSDVKKMRLSKTKKGVDKKIDLEDIEEQVIPKSTLVNPKKDIVEKSDPKQLKAAPKGKIVAEAKVTSKGKIVAEDIVTPKGKSIAKEADKPFVSLRSSRRQRDQIEKKPSTVDTKVTKSEIAEPQPVIEPLCVKKVIADLTDDSEIDNTNYVDPLQSVSSDNEASDDDVMEVNEDPLALPEPIINKIEKKTATITSLSFDFNDSPTPITRVTRKRGRVSPIAPIEISNKKRKTRGKRTADNQLRKSIEEKKKNEESSSEEEIIDKKKIKPIQKKTLLKKSKEKKIPAESIVSNSSDTLSEKPVPKKTVTPRKKTMLGLDISDIATDDISPVRQSRRLAQIKIKEEATRRKYDDFTLLDIKPPSSKKKVKKHDKDFKIQKRKHMKIEAEAESNVSSNEESKLLLIDEAKKSAKKRKHKNPKFDGLHPWKSSSDSDSDSHPEEDEEDEAEEEEAELPLFGSDHEFSMESDVENDVDYQPIKRARTVRKEDTAEEVVDDTNCKKCGKSDHPEWILLCDGCDSGWHCSCLLPVLFVIPEGDWFCPPCQHQTLIKNLQTELVEYDKKLSKREVELRMKERLAYIGISLDNVLPSKEHDNKNRKPKKHASESESFGSSSSSDSDSEPIYQLRQRRQAHSYRFNDYDDLINSAIQDEVDAVAGNQGRGKDIATIVNAKNEEEEEKLPPVVPTDSDLPAFIPENQAGENQDDKVKPIKKIGRKKHRKLNSLDDTSGEDRDSDEDFKGSDDDDDEDEEFEESDSDDSNRGRRAAVRRSGRARVSRFDREFINDDSDDYAPKRKKRSTWDESDSEEESDASWGRRKKRSGGARRAPTFSSSKRRSKKKKKTNPDDSDMEIYRKKKPKIVYGGLETDEEEEVGPRTRGKIINYLDVLGSDTDDDIRRKNAVKDEESEEEFVLNDEEDMPDDEVERDSDDSNSSPLTVPKSSAPIKAYVKKGKGKGGIKRIKRAQGEEEEALFPPLPDSDEKEDEPIIEPTPVVTTAAKVEIPEVPVPDTIEEMNKNIEAMGEKEMEMMMEEEEFANRQLQMVAAQLEKEKRRREMEAKKIIIPIPLEPEPEMLPTPPAPAAVPVHIPVVPTVVEDKTTPRKRGRKPKSEVTSPETSTSTLLPMLTSAQISPDDMGRQSEGEMGGHMPPMLLNLDGTPKKRRGRGKGRKTLEKEAAAAAAKSTGLGISGASSTSMASRDSNDSSDQPLPKTVDAALSSSSKTSSPAESPLLGGKLGVAAAPQPFSQSQPMPSVITRMLQSQPGQASYPVGAMGHKFYDDRPEGAPPLGSSGGPPAASPFMSIPGGPRGVLPGPPGPGYRPQLSHYPVVRSGPPPPHRLRSPGPQNLPPHMYHPHPSTHHTLDAPSSSGGPLPLTTDRSSPSLASPSAGSPLSSKGEPTPPPSGYVRPPMTRFPPISNPIIPRNPLMIPQHLQQPRPNLPYHPGIPPNFHYGHYAPVVPPNVPVEEGPPPPNQFQNAPPYPDQFSEGSSDGPKNYDEENGEFGGLVSYFSSQREDDDLDT